ncbi:MAG: alkaline phosphatase D family protein [Chloroflexi bacterium]|nr:alkaline phosphatase D family protein [Chloroflexota bacterium]
MTTSALLTHGPLVGAVTDRSAALWARARADCTLEVAADVDPARLPFSARQRATANLLLAQDGTGTARLEGLAPDTRYYYAVLLNGQPATPENGGGFPSFRTFPTTDQKVESLNFAFGSCFIPWEYGDEVFSGLSRHAASLDLRLFLMIGDNVYVDEYFHNVRAKLAHAQPVGDLTALYREAYRYTWQWPNFRRFTASIPNFMIFDDHEFWDNWGNIPSERTDSDLFGTACQVYDEYQDSHNPDYDARHRLGPPQYYYSFNYGDIGFFVLDCRTLRNPHAVPFPTLLSNDQRTALFKWLEENNDRFAVKFIVSSVPLTYMAIPEWMVRLHHISMGDQWPGYREERGEVFRFIQQKNITGVHVLSGDVHIGQSVRFEAVESGPDVYSYTSSPLAQSYEILPRETPAAINALAGAFLGAVLGVFFGWWIAFLETAPLPGLLRVLAVVIQGIANTLIGALVGAALGEGMRRLLAVIFHRGRERPMGAALISRLLYRPFQALSYLYFQSNVRRVSGDQITYHNRVLYRLVNLVPPVWKINVGIVRVQRDADGVRVWIEYRDKNGDVVVSEEPHTV